MKTFILVLILNFHQGNGDISKIEQIHGIPTLKTCQDTGKVIRQRSKFNTFVCIEEIRITNLQRTMGSIDLK